MTDDAATAYICIYCPFNSNNLQALEVHLTNEHGCGNQDLNTSQSSVNLSSKTNKRSISDDEQSQNSYYTSEKNIESSATIKRAKRTSSPINSIDGINDDRDLSDEEDQAADERDSAHELNAIELDVTHPNCRTSDPHFVDINRLVKQYNHKSSVDPVDSIGFQSFEKGTSNVSHPFHSKKEKIEQDETKIQPREEQTGETSSANFDEIKSNLNATSCPYCDFKTGDIEQFKSHFIAHIRDKNYRCLLCNRLYKYRGDCSFHIRRKHHRYSQNFNDYIQRFIFNTNEGDESISTQIGSSSLTVNGLTQQSGFNREQEEPARYFGCPYCDYTSNYGGDVRKHQARKHPNLESKVVKIIRQESEQIQQQFNADEQQMKEDQLDEDEEEQIQSSKISSKKKNNKANEKILVSPYNSQLPILPNFAPVRVFQCSICHQQGTYKWVVERHIRAKHPEKSNAHVIELPAELSVKLQKITSPLKRFRCSLCSLQSKHSWVVMRHIKHFHTLQTASVVDIQPDGKPVHESSTSPLSNGDSSNKFHPHDSDSSRSAENSSQEESEDELNDSPSMMNTQDSLGPTYKCSLCDFHSNNSWNVQKHINDKHSEQHTAFVLTQWKSAKISLDESINQKQKNSKQKATNGQTRSLSPASALAKAKFPPIVEEALLSLQGSKLNRHLYSAQPKFGIKRLKCRHCFYRSNWKTDMIRHVRIRHNINEPDHHRDMIVMSEQEARSTIESYENTFGKELRRRTFRTWNDWSKAEQEFTPKDGSLKYGNSESDTPSPQTMTVNPSTKRNNRSTPETKTMLNSDETKKTMKTVVKKEILPSAPNKIKTNVIYSSMTAIKDELNAMRNQSSVVQNVLHPRSFVVSTDDGPLDLSLKPSNSEIKLSGDQVSSFDRNCTKDDDDDNDDVDDDDDDNNDDVELEEEDANRSYSVYYSCSVCPFKRRNRFSLQRHLSLHLDGKGFSCPICSYITINQSSMIRHMTNTHSTSPLPQVLKQSSTVLNASIIEQHQCHICSYRCDHAEAMHNHLQIEHSNQDQTDGQDEEEEYDIDLSDDEADQSNSTPKNVFECPICSPTSETNNLNDLEQLTMHVITQHHNQSCPFCSYTTNTHSQKSLIQHVRLHFNGTLVQPDPVLAVEQVKELLMIE